MPFIEGLFREENNRIDGRSYYLRYFEYALILLGSQGEEELFVGIRKLLAKKRKNKRTILDSKIRQKERYEHLS